MQYLGENKQVTTDGKGYRPAKHLHEQVPECRAGHRGWGGLLTDPGLLLEMLQELWNYIRSEDCTTV